MVHIHNRIFLCLEKNEILPNASIWVDLESIKISEISQIQILHVITQI